MYHSPSCCTLTSTVSVLPMINACGPVPTSPSRTRSPNVVGMRCRSRGRPLRVSPAQPSAASGAAEAAAAAAAAASSAAAAAAACLAARAAARRAAGLVR